MLFKGFDASRTPISHIITHHKQLQLTTVTCFWKHWFRSHVPPYCCCCYQLVDCWCILLIFVHLMPCMKWLLLFLSFVKAHTWSVPSVEFENVRTSSLSIHFDSHHLCCCFDSIWTGMTIAESIHMYLYKEVMNRLWIVTVESWMLSCIR